MESVLTSPLMQVLESLDELSAGLSRLICGRGLERALARWLPDVSIRCVDARTWVQGLDDERQFSVKLRGPAAELDLRLPWSVDAISASVMAAGAWSSTAQLACLRARANGVLVGLLGWLEQLGLHAIELDTSAASFAPSEGAMTFECRTHGHRIDGSLRCRDKAWLAQAQRDIARRGRPALDNVGGLPLPVGAVLGSRRMPLRLLRTVRIGDVVLLGRAEALEGPIEGAMLVIGRRGRGALGWPCTVQGREIAVIGDQWMNTETQDLQASRAHDAPSTVGFDAPASRDDPMGDLEVDLHLELQVISTPLKELAAMRPGYVLELPVAAAESCVDLVVGGRLHGRAQLVCVGGRLGARILELFQDDT